MKKAWEKLVLKWLNCCGVGPIKTIQDVKGKDFLQALALSPVACPDGDEPFHHLLSYLQSNYSQFDKNLNNPDDNSWMEDEELYLVLTLLLLHASIYQPSASFQEKAAQNLSESEQQLIVSFLQKAMKCDQNLTKMDLINCLPSVEGSSSQLQQALISSPVQSKKQRRSQGTPLAEFLLSPVARQRRESGKLRGHLRSLENDLEREQTEKEELMSKISGLEIQVSEIGKRYKDKVHEAEALAEDLRVAQRWQAENVGDFNLEKRKLQQDLCASEKYVQQLENEISTLKIAQEMFQHKLLRSDERAADLEEILKTTKEELTIVKQQMLHDAEENVELNLRCSQLERDLNQIHSSALLSPGRPDVRNISPGSSPAPENLGFILEKEMIAKENKNVMLEATLKELKNELENLKDSYFQLEEKAARENESALRLQNRLQASLDNVQNRLDLSSQELSVLKREKEELISKLSDVLGKNDILVSQVGELSAKKASLVTEQTALLEAQHSLEVKVAQLDARILIAAEREEELHGIIKKRATELNDMSQEMDEMDFKMSKALKERDLMEQQLNNTVKKLTVAKTMELEKANLEYQITSLKQTYDDLKKRSEATEMSKKDLNDKLNSLTEEKKAVDSHLRDVISKRDEIFASFHQVTAEKNTVIAENIALQKDIVHLDAQLTEAQRHITEAKEELLKEEATKKALKNKVAELMASNDLLSSQLSISSQQENDVADQLIEVTKQKNVIENQLMSISKDKEKLNAALNECSSQLAKVSQKRESQNILFTKQTTEYENALSRLNELATSLSCTESQLADERAESSRLKCHITDVTQKFDSALTELNQLKEEMERLHHNLEDKDTAITQLQTEKADIEDDLCHYVCKLNMATQENVSLKSEILSIRDERDTLTSKYESLEQSKSSLEEKISLLNSDLLDACNKKDSLSTELELVSKHRDDLSYQLAEMRMAMSDLEKDLNLVTTRCSVSQEEVLSQSSQIKSLQQELDDMSKDFTSTKKALEDDCYEKSQQLSILRDDLFEVREKSESLVQERNILLTDLHSEAIKNSALEEEVIRYKSQIEILLKEKQHVLRQLTEAQLEKENALTSAKSLQQEIESIVLEKGDLLKTLQEMDEKLKLALLNNDQELKCALIQKEQEIKSEFSEKEEEYKSVLLTQDEKLKAALLDKEKSTNSLELLKTEMSENCEKFYAAEVKYKEMIKVLQDEVERVELDKKSLEAEIHNHSSTIIEASCKIQSLEKQIVENACTIQNLKEKLDVSHADFSRKLQEGIDEPQRLCIKQKELLEKADKEKQVLLSQIDELQSSIDVKDELLTNTRQYLEDLKGEKESLQELLKVKDEIITCQNATASSLERQSCDELDVAMKLLKEEMHSSHSTSSIIAQELKKVQKNFVEEKVKLQKALEEAQSSAKSYQQEAVELKQQLSAPRVGGKLSEFQSEERMWQCDRIKNQVAFQFHSMMTQKIDLEEQLGQLRDILKDVCRICDNLFATLPSSCNAVHEVTMMRQEVESKLRAVDRKYADSLCGIISLADEMFQWIKTQNRVATSTDSAENVSEYDEIDKKVSKSCEGMMSLGIDVRSAINSCKFLIERCESYLRAQTRESLKIKTSITKEEVGTINENCTPSEGGNSLTSIPMTVDLSSNLCTSTAPAEWFGGSASLEEGYKLIKSSYAELENQVCDLRTQLQKFQTPRTHQSTDAHGEQIADLQEQISLLKMRPTQEQLDEKLKELHTQYSSKLECMKVKMKQIVKDEVEKVEEEKLKSEKELIAKYTKRIAEFEEHIQQLSAQLWNLGEKLLKEQQDHKITKERFDALKERQRQYLMSKQRTQSLDRLDLTLQEKNYVTSSSLLSKRRCKSHVAQSGLASSKVHPECDTTIDVVDDSVSRRSTMMAPASMGLAFPEEDEDGEVFNNDYLTELKEGRCRVPSDRLPSDNSRLSVLQHRNSLCPPHLKSSYALETLDPQEVKDEDVKGPVQVVDARYKRQAKDRGTTSYQKPGPPTPSKKAGRLSLQGKEDLTPRVAALREHNDSQSSGIGMLRVGKTTPSRLRALFTSSKVASSTLPSSKKDESSTPATPTTKRLSIFRRRFGSNKENQSSNYSAFQ